MSRATKALVASAGLAGAAAAVMARRPRPGASGSGGTGSAGGEESGASVVTATILRPVDEVTRAWASEAHADTGGPAGDRPVGVDFTAAPGDRGTEVRVRVGPDDAGGGDSGGGHPHGNGDAGRGGGGNGHAAHGGHSAHSAHGGREGGVAGLVARVRGETPVQRQRERLRRFKAELECGEVVTTEGQPSGRGPVQEAATQAVTRRLRAWSGQ